MNFFVAKLVNVANIERKTSVAAIYQCDLCCDFKDTKETASMLCLDCQQYFCSSCGSYHQKISSTKFHKVVFIEGAFQSEALFKISSTFCSNHRDDSLKLYCSDCKSAICMMCFMEEHNLRNCSKIDNIIKQFYDRLDADSTKLTGQVAKEKSSLQEKQLSLQKKLNHWKHLLLRKGMFSSISLTFTQIHLFKKSKISKMRS